MLAFAPASGADEDRGYRLRVPRSVRVELLQLKSLSLTIAPKKGFSISRNGPVRLTIVPPDEGIKIVKTRYRREDSADPQAESPRFDIRLRGTAAGRYEFRIDAFFWLCRKRTCRPVRRQLTVSATVFAPASEVESSPDGGPVGDAGSSLAPGGR